jgi:chromosomal replication initiation ATPase DnaA
MSGADNGELTMARIEGRLPYAKRQASASTIGSAKVSQALHASRGIDPDMVRAHVDALQRRREQELQVDRESRQARKDAANRIRMETRLAKLRQQQEVWARQAEVARAGIEREAKAAALLDERQSVRVLPVTVTVARIVQIASTFYGVRIPEIKGAGRTRRVAKARFGVYWASRVLLGLSTPQIGARMNRDHSTIVSALRKDRAEFDPFIEFAREVLS